MVSICNFGSNCSVVKNSFSAFLIILSSLITNAGLSPMVSNALLLLVWFFLTLVPKWHAIASSVSLWCITMKIPLVSTLTANLIAAKRLTAASDDGLSDDLWEPTSIIGIGNPESANDKNAEV